MLQNEGFKLWYSEIFFVLETWGPKNQLSHWTGRLDFSVLRHLLKSGGGVYAFDLGKVFSIENPRALRM